MFDYSDLIDLMKSKKITQKDLADKIGVSEGQMSHKMKGEYTFKQIEISKIVDILGILPEDISKYFFCKAG